MADVTTPAVPDRVPFAAFLQQARRGGLHTECSDALADLVQACTETGKKGTMTVKLTVDPRGDGVTVDVTDDVQIKAPKAPAPPSIFYHDDRGGLHRRDPRQDELPLRGVQGGRTDQHNEGGATAQGA